MVPLEEDLKEVLKYLPKGTLLNEESFKRAVRYKQYFEDIYGCKEPNRNRGFDKYQTESQIVGLVLMKKGFADPKANVANPFSSDLFNIPKIFEQNLAKYFSNRINGVETSSLKLSRVHFTVSDKLESQSIEKKTKQEIIDLIFIITDNMKDEEKVNIRTQCTKSKNKQFLINRYQELLDAQTQNALNMDENE